MDAIIAIAMLCQVKAQFAGLEATDKYQLNCQKQLINCYFNKANSVHFNPSAQKFLYDCVLERKVKAAYTCENNNEY